MAGARTRVSRTLIVVLGATVLFGAAITLNRMAGSNPEPGVDPAAPVSDHKPVVLVPPSPPAEAVGPATSPAIPATRPTAPAISVTSTPDFGMPAPGLSPAAPTTRDAEPAAAAAAAVASSDHPVDLARQKMQANDLLAARKVLNAALIAGALNDADTAGAKAVIRQISDAVVFSAKVYADDEYGATYNVQRGDVLAKIAASHAVTWELLSRINKTPPQRLRAGQTVKVIQGPFHAVVHKKSYTIDFYLGKPGGQGSLYVTSFPVGLGKDDSTPVGTWQVTAQNKLKNPKFWGAADLPAREADDPQNPLGEFWIGLSGKDEQTSGRFGYGIHGTIEPDSIGKQASHGCIRLRDPDIQLVYEMLVEGKSTVIVAE